MQQNYQDAIAIVDKYCKPDLFITFIPNPWWPDIVDDLLDGVTVFDWPDMVSRMFDLDLRELVDAVTQNEDCVRCVR